MCQRRDESEISAGGSHVDVAARLVRLGFEGELEAVLLVEVVFAEIVQCFAQALDRLIRTTACVRFRSLAATPEHEDLRAQFGAEVHSGHGFLYRIRPNRGIVGGEGAVTENGIVKQVDGRQGNADAMLFARRFEFANNAVVIGGRGIDGYEVVVMQVDTPSSDLSQ